MSALQQALLMASGAGAAAWNDVANYSVEGGSGTGWSGYTLRVAIPSGHLPVNGSKLRFTFKAGATVGAVIGACYIGVAATAGDGFDFATTPTQVQFSASNTVTLSADQEVTCDEVTLSTTTSDGLVISFYFSSTTNLTLYINTVPAWLTMHYKAGNDASTVDASSYTITAAAGVHRIETYG